MKKIFLLAVSLMIIIFISCKKYDQFQRVEYGTIKNGNNSGGSENSGHIKIAVVSDIHYLDPSLLQNNAVTGTAFQSTLLAEPNKALLAYSAPIFNQVISELIYEKPDIVLITGDIAQAGEKISHQAVSVLLNRLRQNGSKVYVTPGNHDINDPGAKSYNGNTSSPVPNVSPAEFTSIYSNFGYGSAIAKDPNSLSYVAEPFTGLWILAIDDAKYSPTFSRSGRIRPETMQWIKVQMAIAKENNITVFGMMHHNIIEHFSGQNQVTPSTVVDEWTTRADSLIAYGLKVMFTGHSHVSDITARVTNGKTFYDIETGSLLTPPSGYRMLVLKNKELEISNNYFNSIGVSLPDNLNFADFSSVALTTSLDNYFSLALVKTPFNLTGSVATYAVPLARKAYMAHIAGDENITPGEQLKIDSLNQVTPLPSYTIWALSTLWTDIGIKDNKWHIKLTDPKSEFLKR